MSRFMKVLASTLLLAFCLFLWLGLSAPTAVASPPDPQPLSATGNCYMDNIFYGAVPPGGQHNPVLVFVHGYSGAAIDWWLSVPPYYDNDMYVRAYNAGYRTAFVNLNVDPSAPDCRVLRTPARSVIYNGFVLALQIEVISQIYGVQQVDIVAHSKGGIDAQAGILWFGAADRVGNVFTLSSPHQGSILADLLWSPEGWWLALLFGERDDATYSIQTAPMQVFRSIADADPIDDSISYYSAAGTDWSGGGGGLAWMGEWLAAQPDGGPNDGAVTVSSTYLPYASVLFQEPWNHSEVFMGRNAFPTILGVLQGHQEKAFREAGLQGSSSMPVHRLNSIVRGGSLTEPVREEFPVEPQAQSIQLSLFTSEADVGALLMGPNGAVHTFEAVPVAEYGLPRMAFLQKTSVEKPEAGLWGLEIDGSGIGGYMLLATLDSKLNVELHGLPDRLLVPGETLTLSTHVSPQPARVKQQEFRWSKRSGNIDGLSSTGSHLEVPVTDHQGFYGTSLSVSGETGGGLPFERTFVRSIAVVDPGELKGSPWLLDELLKP
ncbi:MAG: hypothetical protein U9R25_17075 [Chloroflexota bacterium]|nr:hypothetical protein [Chloroflexota bacterium]